MTRRISSINPMIGLASLALLLGAWLIMAAPALAGGMVANKCLKCHGEFGKMDNVVAGDFNSRSNKAKSISVEVAPGENQIVKFTADTTVANVPNIKALQKPIPVLVEFKKVGPDLVATSITAKPKIKVPDNQLIDAPELAKLVAMGPEKGKFMLLDSRPGVRYQEGHIPGAVAMPFPKMPEMLNKLPKDKDNLLIFYCGGFR